jgi:hypothetical protein
MPIRAQTALGERIHKSLRTSKRIWVLGFAIGLTSVARADLVVPAGSSMNVGAGTVDLACTDLLVAGSLALGTGNIINVRHATIQSGGVVDGGSGVLSVGGNWTNVGTFVPGTGAVRFGDVCSLASASVSGDTSFATASCVSTVGKNYLFAVGSTQNVTNLLQIAGTAANPIQLRSTAPGQVANLNLLPAGTQQIQHVGVTDVWATGQALAPDLTNEGGSGNANRWFGNGNVSARPIPSLANWTLAALAAALAVLGATALPRRRRREGAGRSLPH